MRTKEHGFTLVEILVASVVFTIFMVGMLNLLDTSTKIAQVENSLADTQENVRFAAYHIMRTARMMGGASMPFAGTGAGGDRWVTGELVSNASGTVQIPGFGGVSVVSGSDVLTLRGFFEISPFFTDADVAVISSDTVAISEENGSGQLINDISSFTLSALEGRGIVFMGEGQYCVGRLDSGASIDDSGASRRLLLQHTAGDAPWPDLNTTWTYPPTFEIYRIGVLESYTYFVSPDNVLRRVRISGGGSQAEPVAINIGGIQFSLGRDTNDDGQVDDWDNNPSGAAAIVNSTVLEMRISILGRTEVIVPNWTEPDSTFEVADGSASGMATNAKWRRIDVAVNLRNYKF